MTRTATGRSAASRTAAGRRAGVLMVAAASATGVLAGVPAQRAAAAPAVSSSQVGPGWTAVTTGRSTGNGPAEATTLRLASPTGQVLTRAVPRGFDVRDFSGDGHRVLLSRFRASGQGADFAVLDVRTGHWSRFGLADADAVAGFADTAGTSVLVTRYLHPVRRVDLTGRTLTTYPAATTSPVTTSDSRFLVGTDAQHHATVSDLRTGRLVRRLATPRGAAGCDVVHMLSATVVQVVCGPGDDEASNPDQLYSFDVTTGRGRGLTPGLRRLPASQVVRLYDYWATSAGAVVTGQAGPDLGEQGDVTMRVVKGALTLDPRWHAGNEALDVVGTTLWSTELDLNAQTAASRVVREDLRTGRRTVVVELSRQGAVTSTPVVADPLRRAV